MALFPKYAREHLDSKDRNLQKTIEDFYHDNRYANQARQIEADLDSRFEAGDQRAFFSSYSFDQASQLKNINLNRIRRVVSMTAGHQRKNRKSIVAIPVENADQETADQYSKIIAWCVRRDNILHTISDAFHGACVTGFNLAHVWMDYSDDPESGDIRVDNCASNSFMIDPFFRKKDLSDCNGLWKRSYISKNEAMSLLPGKRDEIDALAPVDHRDGKFEFMPENFDYRSGKLFAYDEYYYKTFRKQTLLIDSQTRETMEWKNNDKEYLKYFLTQNPQITVSKREIPTVNMAVMLQGKIFHDGKNSLGSDSYPFVPVLGYFNPDIPDFSIRIQGMVRGLRDPQYIYNRLKVTQLDISESRVTTGYLAKENALVDIKDLHKTGQGVSLVLKETAQMSDVLPIPTQDIPPSFFTMSESWGREMQEISGVNEELLGSAVDDKAGVLSMLRQGAGLTTLQTLFDQLDMSQQLIGRLIIGGIQENFSAAKVKRILGEEPQPQFYDKAFGIYDVAIEEGFNTTTQMQTEFAQLLHLREAGIPIPDSTLIEAATIQNKKQLTDTMQAESEQQSKMQEMQLQATMKEQEARTELAKSRSIADKGLGIERISRVEENEAFAVERRAEAQKDRTQGYLNIVKALQELETIDIGQIQQLLAISDMLKKQNEPEGPMGNRPSTKDQLNAMQSAGSEGANVDLQQGS